jgi:hypothetical protein
VTGAGQGDFFATVANANLQTSYTTILFTTVASGNSGGWYNTGNGRFTPPAGRYYIFASVNDGYTGTSTNIAIQLRKNGTALFQTTNTTAAANSFGVAYVAGNFDANGSDWFDAQGLSTGGVANLSNVTFWFGAFPITGAAQPAGTGSAWRQLGRVVPTAGLATVDFQNLPADINDVKCFFDCLPTANDVDFQLQFYDTGNTVLTTGYAYALTAPSHTATVGSATPMTSSTASGNTTCIIMNYSTATNKVGNAAASAIAGDFRIPNVRDAARVKKVSYAADYTNGGGSTVFGIFGTGVRNPAGAITGIRLTFGGTTFAAGGAVTLYGSP